MKIPEIRKGLDGVVVDESAVSRVMPESNALTYRGYPVTQLADHCRFEEVAFLLWQGELPTASELKAFTAAERNQRSLPQGVLDSIRLYPKSAHPMDALRTSVSLLGMHECPVDETLWCPKDPFSGEPSNYNHALSLLAKIPTMIAAAYRCRQGLDPINPDPGLPIAENLFHMCFGEIPDTRICKAFDASLTFYAEHGFNASTFTARVVTSTMSDLFSATVAGIASLKGPLHGGANEHVMHVLDEIGDPSRAEKWLLDALRARRKIMGFGHRVYKSGDSRVPGMDRYGREIAAMKNDTRWHKIGDVLKEVMLREKNIHPNLDFVAGPAYRLMGFETPLFTPFFVMARTTGWSAHFFEQSMQNRLIRPISAYCGKDERTLPSRILE